MCHSRVLLFSAQILSELCPASIHMIFWTHTHPSIWLSLSGEAGQWKFSKATKKGSRKPSKMPFCTDQNSEPPQLPPPPNSLLGEAPIIGQKGGGWGCNQQIFVFFGSWSVEFCQKSKIVDSLYQYSTISNFRIALLFWCTLMLRKLIGSCFVKQ